MFYESADRHRLKSWYNDTFIDLFGETPNTKYMAWINHYIFRLREDIITYADWIIDKTYNYKISQGLEAAIFVFRIIRSLWNLAGTSATVLPMCLPNFKRCYQSRGFEASRDLAIRRFVWYWNGVLCSCLCNTTPTTQAKNMQQPINTSRNHYSDVII